MPKVVVSLAQRGRSHSASACAACAPRYAPSILIKWIGTFFLSLIVFSKNNLKIKRAEKF